MKNQQSFQNILFKAIYENSENKLFKESFDPEHLEEGWKDNLKKAAGVAAVAGGLMANNAHALDTNNPMDWEGAQSTGEYTAFDNDYISPLADIQKDEADKLEKFAKDNGFIKIDNDTYKGKDGKEYTSYDLSEFMEKQGAFDEGVDIIEPRYEDDPEVENDEEDWYQIWQDSQLQTDENEPFLNYIERLKNNY